MASSPSLQVARAVVALAVALLPTSALSWTSDWQYPGNVAGHTGFAFQAAGDVDGDGFSDLVLGDPYDDTVGIDAGVAVVVYGSAMGLGAARPALALYGELPGDNFGWSVSTAGDVNGDGFDDLVVGAPGRVTEITWTFGNWDGTNTTVTRLVQTGRWYVHLGSAAGLSPVAAMDDRPRESEAKRGGFQVGSAGDLDGDGRAEWIIQSDNRQVEIFSFSETSGGVSSHRRYRFHESAPFVGIRMSPGMDVNGDGLSDVLIGISDENPTKHNGGAAYLLLSRGNVGQYDLLDLLRLSILDSDPLQNSRFARAAMLVGDVDGDGFVDVAIGDDMPLVNGSYVPGRLQFYRGSANGVDVFPTSTLSGGPTDFLYGFDVAPAGDVNGDGYADILVGSPGTNSPAGDAGRVEVLLGSPNGPDTGHVRSYGGLLTAEQLGIRVAGIGDVNGDGFDDIAFANEVSGGGLFVVYGSPDPPSLTDLWKVEGATEEFALGARVDVAGDVNGDGYEDLAIAAPGILFAPGELRLYLGADGGPQATATWTATGSTTNTGFGEALASGDLDGDGYDDLVVGAPRKNQHGAVLVYKGSAGGLSVTPAWVLEGAQINEEFGAAVSVGDANGDGFADLLVGVPGYDASVTDQGEVRLYFGSASGPSFASDWTWTEAALLARTGAAVDLAGDANGDGFDDLLLGSPGRRNASGTAVGRASLFLGSSSGPAVTAAWTHEGQDAYEHYGAAVLHAGDVDGGASGEIVVAAPDRSVAGVGASAGHVDLFRRFDLGFPASPAWSADGGASGARLGASLAGRRDTNADGLADLLLSEGASGQARLYLGAAPIPATIFESIVVGGSGGGMSVAMGDLNADGFADLVVGSPEDDSAALNGGAVILRSGSGVQWGRSRPLLQVDLAGAPLAVGDALRDVSALKAQAELRPASGRMDLKAQWRVVEGNADIASAAVYSTAWIDPGAPVPGKGVTTLLEADLSTGSSVGPTTFRWQLRERNRSPWFGGGFWRNPGSHPQNRALVRIPPPPPQPDLSVVSITPLETGGGAPVTFDLTVRNAGNQWSIATTVDVVVDSVALCTGIAITPIAPGASQIVSCDGGYLAGGYHSIRVCVDPADAVVESSESNNCRTAVVHVDGPTALTVRADGTGDEPTIQAAINRIAPGGIVYLEDGIYRGSGNRDLSFGGKDLILRSVSGDPFACVLDVEGSATTQHRAMAFQNGETTMSRVINIGFRGGYRGYGGLVLISGAAPFFSGCEFRASYAPNSGGAVHLVSVTGNYAPSFSDCGFDSLSCGGSGGAVTVSSATATFGDSRFRNSSASYGGAIYIYDSSPSFVRCDFDHNSASVSGGAVHKNQGAFNSVFTECTFYGNSSASGGAIYARNSAFVALERCIIAFNSGGGDVACPGSTVTVTSTDSYGNVGGDWTGCLAAYAGIAGNISADPLFCDAANGNLSITVASPCSADSTGFRAIGAHDVGCGFVTVVSPNAKNALTIQDAVNQSSSGDIVELLDGRFVGAGNREIVLNGKNITIRSRSGNASDCIIDAQGSPSSPAHVFSISGVDTTCVITGITMRGAYRTYGGAVILANASPKFSSCVFDSNTAANGAGIFFTDPSGPVIEDCVFYQNTATDAGAVAVTGSPNGVFRRCRFDSNHGLWTGAIYYTSGSTRVEDSIFVRNTSDHWGGAIYAKNASSPVIVGTTFISNDSPEGGHVHVAGGAMVSLSRCLLTNSAQSAATFCSGGSTINLYCSDLFNNPGGDYTGCVAGQIGVNSNISLDPLLCEADSSVVAVAELSPCLTANNGCGGDIGLVYISCYLTDTPPANERPQVAFLPNYPNPFNPTTTFEFDLPTPSSVTLAIYDLSGRRVRTVFARKDLDDGHHRAEWDGRDDHGIPVASGVYMVQLSGGEAVLTRKIALIK